MWRNGVSTSWRWVSANKGAEVGIHLADTGWQAVQCKCVVLRLGLGISLFECGSESRDHACAITAIRRLQQRRRVTRKVWCTGTSRYVLSAPCPTWKKHNSHLSHCKLGNILLDDCLNVRLADFGANLRSKCPSVRAYSSATRA